MSTEAVKAALALPQVTGNTKVVLVALADRAGDEADCWPSVSRIAVDTALCERTVIRAIRELSELGLIHRISRAGKDGKQISNRYELAFYIATPSLVTGSGGDNSVRGRVTTVSGGRVTTVSPPLKRVPLLTEPSEENHQSARAREGFGVVVSRFTEWELEQARQLKRALYTAKTSTCTSAEKVWAEQVRQLRKTDKHSEDVISYAIEWYAKHGSEQYTPKAKDPYEFRAKFPKILAAIDRAGGRPLPVSDKAAKAAKWVLQYTGPLKIDAEQVIQRSIDNYAKFSNRCKNLEGSPRLKAFAKYLVSMLVLTPPEWLLEQVQKDPDTTRAESLIWATTHKEVIWAGTALAVDYTGTEQAWYDLLELLSESK